MDNSENKTRLFETKDGLKSVPATQQPMEARAYFANARLPAGMERMDVFITEAGPVIDRKPPMEWSEKHDKLLGDVVTSAKQSIDENGYYLRQATRHLKGLASETTKSLDDVFEDFHKRFEAQFGEEPGKLVKQWRIERNLPTSTQEVQPTQDQEPEF